VRSLRPPGEIVEISSSFPEEMFDRSLERTLSYHGAEARQDFSGEHEKLLLLSYAEAA
jgi:hypothetical protein